MLAGAFGDLALIALGKCHLLLNIVSSSFTWNLALFVT
jgi:hypothetical protein